MKSQKRVGRTVGLLLLVHLVAGLTVPFIMLHPVILGRGFLEGAAANATQLRAAVLLFFVGSAIPIGIAITAFPVLRRFSSGMALWLFALAVASFSLQTVDNAALLSLLSVSQQYANAGAEKVELFQALAIVAGSARKWAHFTFLLVVGCWFFLLFIFLYRFRLVPRVLAAFGIVGSMLQITGVTLRSIWGYPPETRLAMPLAPAYIAIAVWLMVKGFHESHRAVPAEEHEVEVV